MKEGDEWEVVIPSALGYGDRAVGDKIPPNSDLIFRMALLDVDPEFTLWQQFQQFLRSPVEGLPIQLQMWQALVFFIYLGFRLFSKQLGKLGWKMVLYTKRRCCREGCCWWKGFCRGTTYLGGFRKAGKRIEAKAR